MRIMHKVTIRHDERPLPDHGGVDVNYDQNNGTIAIEPTRSGLLAAMVLTYRNPDEDGRNDNRRVWVFTDPYVWTDENGNERIDHHTCGLTCGSHQDGHYFLEMCRKIGLNVRRDGMFVPLSNGQRRYGHFHDNKPFNDYGEDEQVCVRWDLPNEQELRDTALAALATPATT